MRLLPKSIHWCRRYPTKFNSGRDIPAHEVSAGREFFDVCPNWSGVAGASRSRLRYHLERMSSGCERGAVLVIARLFIS